MAIKLERRKVTGRFKEEEDNAIIEKVRVVCKMPGNIYRCH